MEKVERLSSPRVFEKLWLACSENIRSENAVGGGIGLWLSFEVSEKWKERHEFEFRAGGGTEEYFNPSRRSSTTTQPSQGASTPNLKIPSPQTPCTYELHPLCVRLMPFLPISPICFVLILEGSFFPIAF